MRCFSKRAVQQQHLQEEVKWLQQMLAKEQQSKQAVLGQLQDERAKSALLELEILHAAQAAQEMGESLCMFFNPCFSNQQSEQALLQQAQGQASSEQHTPSAEQQLDEEPALLSAGLFAVDCSQQQQEPAVQPTAAELGKGNIAEAPAPAAEASQRDAVSAGFDADTAAHDQQTPPRLRESAALLASTDQWPSEARLHSPRRSLKALGSPGRKSSPRRLARSSPCRSLRLSNSSSPMKPPAVSAAAAASAACERSSGTDQQQQQQQHVQSDGPCRAQSCQPPEGVKDAQGPAPAATAAAASSADNVDAAQQMSAQPRSAPQQQAPVNAPADAASADVPGSIVPANSKPGFRAAAAAAAAVQQSLSAARAAIAAAEAVRGQSRANTARSHHRGGSPGSNNQTAPAAGASTLSVASEKSAPCIAAGATEAPVVSSLRVDTAAADLGKDGSGLECKSSSSDGSTWGGPSHKLPASIVSEPQQPAGAPTAATEAAADNQSAPLPDSGSLQEGQQTGSSAAAPAAICPLWQPAQLSSQPVSQLVSSLSRKSQTRSNSSSSGAQGSPAAASLEPGAAAGHQHTGGSNSNSARSFAVTQHSEPEQQVQQAAEEAAESDAAAPPAKPAGSEADTADPTDTVAVPAAADVVQGTATDAVGSAGPAAAEKAAPLAVPAAQPAYCSLGAGAVPAPAAAGSSCRLPLAGAAAVRRSSAARPPLPPVPAASAAQHAALKLAYGPSHRQACSSRGNSAAGTPRAAEDRSALPRLTHPRLQEQQQQQQGPPPRAAAAVAAVGTVGPMHAAAVGPQQHSGTQFSTSGTLQGVTSSNHAQGGSMPEYKASVYQTGRQAAAAAAAAPVEEDIYANLPPVPEVYKSSTLRSRQQQPGGQRQLMPRRLYSDDTGSDTQSDRQRLLMPQHDSSLHGPPAWSAAAATATRAGAAGPAHAAGKELDMCYAAVCAPFKEAAAASCLSPLHWHQSNLGSSRAGFYQALMLAACSSPTRVMQQQRAFDQQDTQAAACAACRQLAGRGAGGSGRGLMSGKGHRAAAARKPRRAWMALF